MNIKKMRYADAGGHETVQCDCGMQLHVQGSTKTQVQKNRLAKMFHEVV